MKHAAQELQSVTGMTLENCLELAKMFAGDTNRAAIFYLNQGSEAFLKKLAEAQEAEAIRLSMATSSESKDNDGESLAEQTRCLPLKRLFLSFCHSMRRKAYGVQCRSRAPRVALLRERVQLHTLDGLALTAESSLSPAFGDASTSAPVSKSLAPSSLMRQSTADILAPVHNPKPLDLAVQAAKFFNSQLWYDDTEIIWVLRSLDEAAESERRVAFEATSNCRLRDRPDWKGTSVAHVFHYSNYDQLLRLRVVTVKVQRRLAAQFETTTLAFQKIDRDGTGFLTFEELTQALQNLPDMAGITEADCAALMKHIDHNADGYIDYREFVSNFASMLCFQGTARQRRRQA